MFGLWQWQEFGLTATVVYVAVYSECLILQSKV